MQSVNCCDSHITDITGKSTYMSFSDLEKAKSSELRKYEILVHGNMTLKTSCIVYMWLRDTSRSNGFAMRLSSLLQAEQLGARFQSCSPCIYQVFTKLWQSIWGAVWLLESSCCTVFALGYPSVLDMASKKGSGLGRAAWHTRCPLMAANKALLT